jgi:hypothetical protein
MVTYVHLCTLPYIYLLIVYTGAMSEKQPVEILRASLPFYDSGFVITAVHEERKDGQWGEYVWGRAVFLTGRVSKKAYVLRLKESDTLLGALLYMHSEGKPNVLFTRGSKGDILASSAL